jgi:hypothetical protein
MEYLLREAESCISDIVGGITVWNAVNPEGADEGEMTSLLKVMVMLDDAPPDFVTQLFRDRDAGPTLSLTTTIVPGAATCIDRHAFYSASRSAASGCCVCCNHPGGYVDGRASHSSGPTQAY